MGIKTLKNIIIYYLCDFNRVESWKLQGLPEDLKENIKNYKTKKICSTKVSEVLDYIEILDDKYNDFINEDGLYGYIGWLYLIKNDNSYGKVLYCIEMKHNEFGL